MSVLPRRQGSIGTGLSITLTPDTRPDEILIALHTAEQVKKVLTQMLPPVEERLQSQSERNFTTTTLRMERIRAEGELALRELRAALLTQYLADHNRVMMELANTETRFLSALITLSNRISEMERRTPHGRWIRLKQKVRYLWWRLRHWKVAP